MTAAFDTLKLARALRDEARFTQEQAEGIAKALGEALTADMTTKADLNSLGADLSAEIAAVRVDLSAEIAAVRADLSAEIAAVRADLSTEIAAVRVDIEKLEMRLTIKVGAMIAAAIAIVAALVRLL